MVGSADVMSGTADVECGAVDGPDTPSTRRGNGLGWRDWAACRDQSPGLWFSSDRAGQQLACSICAACPVRSECLAEALAIEDRIKNTSAGIFGGLRAKDRDALRKASRQATLTR
jgi:hypothetical protein